MKSLQSIIAKAANRKRVAEKIAKDRKDYLKGLSFNNRKFEATMDNNLKKNWEG